MASGKNSNSGNLSNPKDAQVMAAILKDMGIIEYEPRVINQMLEFTYKYVTTMLDDARLFSSHAKKKNIDVDDVRLAIQLQMDKSFTCPPPRDLLLEVARQKNSTPLPLIKSSAGARLPPDRYCLSACNYRLKPHKKPRVQINVPSSKVSFSSLQSGSSNITGPSISRVMPALPLASKSGTVLSVVTKTVGSPTVTLVTRTVTTPTPSKGKMTPTPIFKLSQGPVISSSPLVSVKTSKPTTTSTSAVTSQNISVSQSLTDLPENEKKRKREDDPDDYNVE